MTDDAQTTDTQPMQDPQSVWKSRFAGGTFVLAVVLAFLLLIRPVADLWQVGVSDWRGTEGPRFFAASIGLPITIFGGLAVAVGVWMAVVEWRGRFVPEKKDDIEKQGEEELGAPTSAGAAEIIKAIGTLKGAALVLVTGAALMIGAAWIAASGADAPTTRTPTTNTTPTTPTATTPTTTTTPG